MGATAPSTGTAMTSIRRPIRALRRRVSSRALWGTWTVTDSRRTGALRLPARKARAPGARPQGTLRAPSSSCSCQWSRRFAASALVVVDVHGEQDGVDTVLPPLRSGRCGTGPGPRAPRGSASCRGRRPGWARCPSPTGSSRDRSSCSTPSMASAQAKVLVPLESGPGVEAEWPLADLSKRMLSGGPGGIRLGPLPCVVGLDEGIEGLEAAAAEQGQQRSHGSSIPAQTQRRHNPRLTENINESIRYF